MVRRIIQAAAAVLGVALAAAAFAQQPARPAIQTTKVPGTDNVYVFRNVGHQAMFVVTSEGVIVTDPVAYGRPTGAAPPDARAVGTVDAIVGWYTPAARGWARAGVDIATTDATALRAPHLVGAFAWMPDWRAGGVALAPRVELHAGIAENQDDLLRTRLGGLNPWVVPLAGAAWAEWWVEDYAAARLGGTVGAGEPGAKQVGVRVSPFVDLATFDGDAAAGFGLGVRAWRGRLFADLTGGVAPWIPRQDNVGRTSVWFAVGWDWGTRAGPSDAGPPGPPGVDWPPG
jgi:hypothetical protein